MKGNLYSVLYAILNCLNSQRACNHVLVFEALKKIKNDLPPPRSLP